MTGVGLAFPHFKPTCVEDSSACRPCLSGILYAIATGLLGYLQRCQPRPIDFDAYRMFTAVLRLMMLEPLNMNALDNNGKLKDSDLDQSALSALWCGLFYVLTVLAMPVLSQGWVNLALAFRRPMAWNLRLGLACICLLLLKGLCCLSRSIPIAYDSVQMSPLK